MAAIFLDFFRFQLRLGLVLDSDVTLTLDLITVDLLGLD